MDNSSEGPLPRRLWAGELCEQTDSGMSTGQSASAGEDPAQPRH